MTYLLIEKIYSFGFIWGLMHLSRWCKLQAHLLDFGLSSGLSKPCKILGFVPASWTVIAVHIFCIIEYKLMFYVLQVNLKPKVPTKSVCAEHLELRKEILTLLNLQKQVHYIEDQFSRLSFHSRNWQNVYILYSFNFTLFKETCLLLFLSVYSNFVSYIYAYVCSIVKHFKWWDFPHSVLILTCLTCVLLLVTIQGGRRFILSWWFLHRYAWHPKG